MGLCCLHGMGACTAKDLDNTCILVHTRAEEARIGHVVWRVRAAIGAYQVDHASSARSSAGKGEPTQERLESKWDLTPSSVALQRVARCSHL